MIIIFLTKNNDEQKDKKIYEQSNNFLDNMNKPINFK